MLLLAELVKESRADLMIGWNPQETSWLSLKAVITGGASPAYYCSKKVGVAQIRDASDMAMVAWLGVACDYPLVAPKVKSRLLLVGVGRWVAHVYDDRGMDVAFANDADAIEYSGVLRARGCFHASK